MASSNCDFCRKFATSASPKQWYDEELLSAPDFVVIPALGVLTVGSIMVVTREHHLSMKSAPEATLRRILAVTREIRWFLTGEITVMFEHGAGAGGGGGCVDHAHFQIVPLSGDIHVDCLLKGPQFQRFHTVYDGLQFVPPSTGYLLIEDEREETHVAVAPSVSPQHVRRLLATRLSAPDEWDYVAFPHYAEVEATIDKFKTFRPRTDR